LRRRPWVSDWVSDCWVSERVSKRERERERSSCHETRVERSKAGKATGGCLSLSIHLYTST
jgi:hypothetical protein